MISLQRMEFIIIDDLQSSAESRILKPFRNKPLIRNRSEPKIIEETIFHCNSVSLPWWCQIAGSGGGMGGREGGGLEWGLVVDLSTPFRQGSLAVPIVLISFMTNIFYNYPRYIVAQTDEA